MVLQSPICDGSVDSPVHQLLQYRLVAGVPYYQKVLLRNVKILKQGDRVQRIDDLLQTPKNGERGTSDAPHQGGMREVRQIGNDALRDARVVAGDDVPIHAQDVRIE